MGSFVSAVLIYLAGGITFLPLLLCLLLLHAHLTSPYVHDKTAPPDPLELEASDGQDKRAGESLHDLKTSGENEKEFGGYFAVCREWIPGGINGKPPERTTPAGEVIAEESPSVYQSMYRSLFDRRQAPTMDVAKQNGKAIKRARNVFYIVLRHGHLMLYDDSEQVEVRHVISLAHHDVGVYAGGEEIPEGELWIKRNAIYLTRKTSARNDLSPVAKPFYLFSENCSDKEDFYFALLSSQERNEQDDRDPPLAQRFEVKHIVGLVQRLHSSEEHLQTRWINAIIGRLFLGIYKTQEIEDLIRMKITKKISRVNKPAFLSGIVLKKIVMGDSAPFITNPRLKDLTVEGDCCVECSVKYGGNFRIEVATSVRIDLGTRFKPREVDLVLAITLKKLEGHLLVRFKPPPSNRIWVAFETMPRLEMQVEPIVSSRQITYSIVLRAIENRIREVVAETLVLPNWDDSPFLDTHGSAFRGGIWEKDRRDSAAPTETVVPEDDISYDAEAIKLSSPSGTPTSHADEDRTTGMPVLVDSQHPSLMSRKGHKSNMSLKNQNAAASSGVQKRTELPRSIRSKSFAAGAAATPIVSTDSVKMDPARPDAKQSKDAASFMAEISIRSPPNSPPGTPAKQPPPLVSPTADKDAPHEAMRFSSRISDSELGSSQTTLTSAADTLFARSPASLSTRSTASSLESKSSQPSKFATVARGLTPSEKKQQSIAAAAAAAKNWGWKTLSRGKPIVPTAHEGAGTPEHPIGRGRPLPPPGQPLPLPEKRPSSSSFTIPLPRRKPLAPTHFNDPTNDKDTSASTASRSGQDSKDGMTLAPTDASNRMLVVEVPHDSEPNSPFTDDDGYGEFMDNIPSDYDDENVDTYRASASAVTQNIESPSTNDRDSELHRSRNEAPPLSTSYEEDDHGLASWQSAQEEESRFQSVWPDEHEHP